jgi:hypothetical protein
VSIDPDIDSQIVTWSKWAASSLQGAIHDTIIPTGQKQTAWKLTTVGNKAAHSSRQSVTAKVLVNALVLANQQDFVAGG